MPRALLALLVAAVVWAGSPPRSARAQGQTLSLRDVYQLALQQNTDLRITQETVVKAELMRSRSWSGLRPTITATASYTRNPRDVALDFRLFNPASTLPPITILLADQLNAGVKLHQPLIAPAAIVDVVSKGINRDVARYELERVRLQLLQSVARAYLDILAAQDTITVAERTRVGREQHLANQKILLANGAAVETTVTQAEIDVADADRQILDAKTAEELARERLRVLCRLPDGFSLSRPNLTDPGAIDTNGLLDEALSRRPEMRSARYVVSKDNIVRWDARAKFFPEVAFDATGTWANAPGFAGTNYLWTLQVNATWVLYDGGARYADKQSRESDVRDGQLRLIKARDQITSDVRSGLVEVRRAAERWKLLQRESELARKNESAVKIRFGSGAATPLELSDAGTRRLSAELSEVSARYTLQAAQVGLEVAVGRDVSR